MSREVDHYELVIDVRGEHYSDRLRLEGESPIDLDPQFVVRGALLFERYRGENGDSWTEVRADHVVARRQSIVYRETRERGDIDPIGALGWAFTQVTETGER